jgi:hypothetical protein
MEISKGFILGYYSWSSYCNCFIINNFWNMKSTTYIVFSFLLVYLFVKISMYLGWKIIREIKNRRIKREYKARLRQSKENLRLVNEYIKNKKS